MARAFPDPVGARLAQLHTMKETYLNGHRLRIYDNGGKTADRYTVLFMDQKERGADTFACLGMDKDPFHPCGIGQHSSGTPGVHLGRRIPFDLLPEPCRRTVLADCPRNGFHEVGWCYSTSPAASALGFPDGCFAVFFVPVVKGVQHPPIAVSGHTTRRGADSACARLNS